MGHNNPVQEIDTFMKWKRIVFYLSYNIINLVLLIICFHFTTTIRSDGPSGFIELIIKGWILALSISFWVTGLIFSVRKYCYENPRTLCFFGCVLTSVLLLFFSTLGVIDACSDGKGYCRNWQIVAIYPKNWL
jgi:hypothetical protein